MKTFVCYTHDSDAHKARVLDLAQSLRRDGIDTVIDRFVPHPPQGWPRWMSENIAAADAVLIVCTETYCRRFEGAEAPGVGRGAVWESFLTMQELYEASTRTNKFIPVVYDGGENVPVVLRAFTRYHLPSDYLELLRRLTNQPDIVPEPLGKTPSLPPRAPSRHAKLSPQPPCTAQEIMSADPGAESSLLWALALARISGADQKLINAIEGELAVVQSTGVEPGSYDRWPDGAPIRIGSSWYYPNGKYINIGETRLYPNGHNANIGESWYYPDGRYLNIGDTCYTPLGEPLYPGQEGERYSTLLAAVVRASPHTAAIVRDLRGAPLELRALAALELAWANLPKREERAKRRR